jgi:hypothetical protein
MGAHIVGDVVLSTTLLEYQRCGQSGEQRIGWKRLGVNARSSEPPKRTMKEWRQRSELEQRKCLMDNR